MTPRIQRTQDERELVEAMIELRRVKPLTCELRLAQCIENTFFDDYSRQPGGWHLQIKTLTKMIEESA